MTTNSAKFATFAPYTPPPDDRSTLAPAAAPNTGPKAPSRPWFPVHASSYGIEASYQSGGVPIFDSSASGGGGQADEAQSNQWETRYGWRVDALAAFAYLLGPISALALLIFETTNDYVRFHAYQSALLLTPLVIARILAALIGFWSWLQTMLTLCMVFPALYMAFHAYQDAAQNGLARFHIPRIGVVADAWVENE